ncbi:MAG: HD-GYP domain-containing protein [Candidatus Micrarchaeia archaeon]
MSLIERLKEKNELRKRRKIAIKAFRKIPPLNIDLCNATSIDESARIQYVLNLKQLEKALQKNNIEEARAAILDIGDIAKYHESIREDFSAKMSEKERGLIRQEILRHSVPSLFMWVANRMMYVLNKIREYSLKNFLLDITSVSSWIKARQSVRDAYDVPSEENIKKAGLQNMVAVFDTLTLGIIAYLAYDFVKDMHYEIMLLKSAGVLTFRMVAQGALTALATKILALASVDAFKSSEQKHLERQIVGLKTIEAVVLALGARDEYTMGHNERVCEYSEWIARELALGRREIQIVTHAAKLHDLGKLSIPDNILLKKGKLSNDEFMYIMRHPLIGYLIASQIVDVDEILLGILQHHEKLDGSGYYEMKGDEIHLCARIIAVADIFDALTTNRPYHTAISPNEAFAELHAMVEQNKLDPNVVNAFEKVYHKTME